MYKRIKKTPLFLLLLFLLSVPVTVLAADTYTVTVPAGTETTMQVPSSLVPVTLTNNSTTKSITEIEIKGFTAQYIFNNSTIPPAGWCLDKVKPDKIKLKLIQPDGSCDKNSTASAIAPGASLVFNINITPVAAAADVTTDTLKKFKVKRDKNMSFTGTLPVWTRRSLEATIAATPGSVGTGDEITIAMQVVNRSTATQNGLTSTPVPPTASNAIVTNTGGPYYGTALLTGDHTPPATTITVNSTTGFPSIGTIKIDTEELCYTGTTPTTFTGVTRGCNLTVPANHSNNALIYDLTPFNLAPDATGTIYWTYSADSTGSVYFTTRATNDTGTAKSISTDSNTVIIGDFTATLSVSPPYSLTGQNITATMTVKNNGASTLINVTPSTLTGCAGGATETLSSGPSPALYSSLAPGQTVTFTWTYQVTGALGATYCLTGNATADGGATTNTVTSNSGQISNYTVTLSPSVIASGAVNQAFNWTVYNGSACTIDEVKITTPAGGGNWACSSVTPPAGWSASCKDTVKFKSNSGAADIVSGGSLPFGITFSATQSVTVDTVVEFPVRLKCGGQKVYMSSFVTLTTDIISMAHTPLGPVSADGTSTYTVTATLTSNGNPLAGKTVSFATTNGSLGATSAITDSSGVATMTLTAPISTTATTADVTATYFNASATDTLSFTG